MSFVAILAPAVERWFYTALVSGSEARLQQAGYDVLVHQQPVTGDVFGDVEQLLSRDAATGDHVGTIGHGVPYGARKALGGRSVPEPLVTTGGTLPGIPSVVIDEVGAVRGLTERMISMGHRRIAFVTTPVSYHLASEGRRLRGYRLAMDVADLQSNVCEITAVGTSRPRLLELLTSADSPTAVIGAWDEVALEVLDTAQQLSLTPGQQLSVAGFDGHPTAIERGLTTVDCRPETMGATSAELLLTQLHSAATPPSALQPTHFVRGNTTGPPR